MQQHEEKNTDKAPETDNNTSVPKPGTEEYKKAEYNVEDDNYEIDPKEDTAHGVEKTKEGNPEKD